MMNAPCFERQDVFFRGPNSHATEVVWSNRPINAQTSLADHQEVPA